MEAKKSIIISIKRRNTIYPASVSNYDDDLLSFLWYLITSTGQAGFIALINDKKKNKPFFILVEFQFKFINKSFFLLRNFHKLFAAAKYTPAAQSNE